MPQIFGKSPLSPMEEFNALSADFDSARQAYISNNDRQWRAQLIGTMGLTLKGLIRSARKIADTSTTAPNAIRKLDEELCTKLEGDAAILLNKSAKLNAYDDRGWPADFQKQFDDSAVQLIESADIILSEVRAIVSKHSQ